MWTELWENLVLSVAGMKNGTQNLIKEIFDGHVFLIPLRMRWISIWHERVACYDECQTLTAPSPKKKVRERFQAYFMCQPLQEVSKMVTVTKQSDYMCKLIEVMSADQFDSESSRQTYLNQSPKFSGLNSLHGNKDLNQKLHNFWQRYTWDLVGTWGLFITRKRVLRKYCVVV